MLSVLHKDHPPTCCIVAIQDIILTRDEKGKGCNSFPQQFLPPAYSQSDSSSADTHREVITWLRSGALRYMDNYITTET